MSENKLLQNFKKMKKSRKGKEAIEISESPKF